MPSSINGSGAPYNLLPSDCIGDSLAYINGNTSYFNNQIALNTTNINANTTNINANTTNINTLQTLVNTVSTSVITSPTVAKAWVSFNGRSTNGTCTIIGSYNVSAVTRISKGNYTITFATPLNNTYYTVAGNAAGVNNVSYAGGIGASTKLTTSFTVVVPVIASSGTVYDPTNGADVIVFSN